MSKQRVFKLNYLLRGKQHNKRSSTLFQLQKYDCHMLVPSPSVLLTSWSSRFFSVLSFLIRWDRRKCSRLSGVIGWATHRSPRGIFRGGAFQVLAFTSQQRKCWNSRPSAGAFGDTRFKMITFSHRHRTECVVFTPASVPTYLRRFSPLSLNYGRTVCWTM